MIHDLFNLEEHQLVIAIENYIGFDRAHNVPLHSPAFRFGFALCRKGAVCVFALVGYLRRICEGGQPPKHVEKTHRQRGPHTPHDSFLKINI